MGQIIVLLLISCHLMTVIAQIEIANPMGMVMGHLDNIQPDDTVATLIQQAMSLLEENKVFMKSNSYFQFADTIIHESHHELGIADLNIYPQSIDDKPSQLVFHQPDHSFVNISLMCVLSVPCSRKKHS